MWNILKMEPNSPLYNCWRISTLMLLFFFSLAKSAQEITALPWDCGRNSCIYINIISTSDMLLLWGKFLGRLRKLFWFKKII